MKGRARWRRRWTWLACLGFIIPFASVTARQPPDLTTLSVEELMQIEVEPVFGASRRLQPVTEAPSSVTIITADDIARFGYRTLADILQGVRGFYVTDDRNYSFVGSRGFALPGDYNTRVLLLVDGHRINDAIYEQAQVGYDFGLDPGTFERVEIIRGPGSSLYGTSAFFAVVNVITKGASDGVSVAVDGGQLGTRGIRTQAAGALSDDARLFVAASSYASDGVARLYFPEYADENGGVAERLDGESARSVFAKLTWHGATLTGAATTRTKAVPTAAFDTAFNAPTFETTDGRAYLDLNAGWDVVPGRLTIRGYGDRYWYSGTYPYLLDGASVDLDDWSETVWWGTETRLSMPRRGRHTMTVGAEYRNAVRQDQGATTPGYPEDDVAIEQASRFWALFVDDELRVHEKVLFNLGVRYDSYAGFDRLTPRAAVIVNRSPNEAFKYLFGTAFRAPNAYELDYYTSGDRSANLQPETAATHEVVWERYVGSWLRTSVSAYFSDVNRLLRLVADAEGNLSFRNLGAVHARGLEAEAEVRNRSGWGALAGYGLQEAVDQDTRHVLSNSPRHLLQGRAWAPLPLAGSTLSLELRAMSRRRTLQGAFVDRATIVNLGVVAPIGRRFALEAHVRNLFGTTTADPGSEEHRQDTIPQNGRVARVGLTWRWQR